MSEGKIKSLLIQNYNKTILWFDYGILFCLSVLIFILPVAHTATIRAFATYISLGLLIVRYFITKDFKWVRTSFEWLFFAFFIVAVASLPTSVDFYESLGEIRGELLTPILLFYIVYFAIKKEKEGVLLLNVLFLGSLFLSIYSFYDFQKHGGTWLSATYRVEGLKGRHGYEPLSLYHSMVIPLFFWGLFYFKNYWLRLRLLILLAINLLALHITFTRAAYFAVGAQMLLIAVLLFFDKKWISGLIILTVFIGISFIFVELKIFREMHTQKLPSLKEYIALTPEEIAGESTSMQKRLAMWKTAIEEISKNPFYPHGYGRFLFGKSVRNEKNRYFIYPQVHNTFIGITFELGIQGLIIFLWMIVTFLWVCLKKWRNIAEDLTHYLSASLLTMMLGYWVNNFFGSFDGDDSKLLFMMMLGIGMAVMHKLQNNKGLNLSSTASTSFIMGK